MFLGQTIVAENFNPDAGVTNFTAIVYTPWIPKGGERGTFSSDVPYLAPSNSTNTTQPTITMTVQTKNLDELDSSAVDKGNDSHQTTDSTYATAQALTVESTGLKELVRLKFALSDEGSSPPARVYACIVKTMPPSFSPE